MWKCQPSKSGWPWIQLLETWITFEEKGCFYGIVLEPFETQGGCSRVKEVYLDRMTDPRVWYGNKRLRSHWPVQSHLITRQAPMTRHPNQTNLIESRDKLIQCMLALKNKFWLYDSCKLSAAWLSENIVRYSYCLYSYWLILVRRPELPPFEPGRQCKIP